MLYVWCFSSSPSWVTFVRGTHRECISSEAAENCQTNNTPLPTNLDNLKTSPSFTVPRFQKILVIISAALLRVFSSSVARVPRRTHEKKLYERCHRSGCARVHFMRPPLWDFVHLASWINTDDRRERHRPPLHIDYIWRWLVHRMKERVGRVRAVCRMGRPNKLRTTSTQL